MLAVFESVIPVFAIIVLGFSLRKGNFVPAQHWRVIENLCFWIFFPCILAETLIKANFESLAFGPFTLTLLATISGMMILTLALWPLLRKFWGTGRPQYSTVFQTTTRWHGFIALAIVLDLYGVDGAALIAVAFAVMVPTLQIINIFVLVAFGSSQQPGWWTILKSIFGNPIIWGVLIGLSINLTDIMVWKPVMTILDLLGRAALGSSLLVLGAGLSLQAALHQSRELWVGVTGKLLLTPALMALFAIAFGVDGLGLSVVLVCAAVPAAMNGFLLARKMGGDAELYATISTVQTVLSFLTIPLVLWLARSYLGAL